jgi:hypothetical protein
MSADTGSCYIWGLPNICRDCKQAIARGETENPNPACCWPRPIAAVEEAVEEAQRWREAQRRREPVWRRPAKPTIKLRSGRSYRPRWPGRDLPAEPTTPHSEVVDSLPPEPEVDEDAARQLADHPART